MRLPSNPDFWFKTIVILCITVIAVSYLLVTGSIPEALLGLAISLFNYFLGVSTTPHNDK